MAVTYEKVDADKVLVTETNSVVYQKSLSDLQDRVSTLQGEKTRVVAELDSLIADVQVDITAIEAALAA